MSRSIEVVLMKGEVQMANKKKASKIKDITGKKITAKKKLNNIKGGALAKPVLSMRPIPTLQPKATTCSTCTCTMTAPSATYKQSNIDAES